MGEIINKESLVGQAENDSAETVSSEDLLAKEKRQLEKFKQKVPELYESAKEEFQELESRFKALEGEIKGDNPDLKDLKREFALDLRGLKNIGRIEGVDNTGLQDFIGLLNNDEVSEEQEEKIYTLLQKKSIIDLYIKSGGTLPTVTSNVSGFIEGVEHIKVEKKIFFKFIKNIKQVKDFSKLGKDEIEDILKSISKYEKLKFNLQHISLQITNLKLEVEKRKYKNTINILSNNATDVYEKKSKAINDEKEFTAKNLEATRVDKVAIDYEVKKNRERVLVLEQQVKLFNDLKIVLGKDFSDITPLNNLGKIKKDDRETDKEYADKLEQAIGKVNNFFTNEKNLLKILDSAKKQGSSKYKEIYDGLRKSSELIASALHRYQIPEPGFEGQDFANNSTYGEKELAGIIAGNSDNLGNATKLSQGRYSLDNKEFDFSDGGAKVSLVDSEGYKIQLGSISYDDLEPLGRINDEITEQNKRLGSLQNELQTLKNQLGMLTSKEPLSEEDIQELKQKIEAKKLRIKKTKILLEDLKNDRRNERKELSHFITKDKQEKVEKSQNILKITGITKFLPQSFINEFFARINLSPTLRASLGFARPIDLSEGILGFNANLGEAEVREKFGEMVNAMISKDKTGPLDIDAIRNNRIGYGEITVESEAQRLISKNIMIVGTPDVSRAIHNIKESQKAKNQE